MSAILSQTPSWVLQPAIGKSVLVTALTLVSVVTMKPVVYRSRSADFGPGDQKIIDLVEDGLNPGIEIGPSAVSLDTEFEYAE